MIKQIFLSSCILLFTATGSFGQCDVDFSNPAAVGDFILNAIKESNVPAFECTFNKVNRSKSGNVKGFMQECIKFTEGVNKITELRRYERRKGVVWVICKLKAIDHEMMVITLSLENGKYLFEDINSPDVSQYEQLPIIDIKQE